MRHPEPPIFSEVGLQLGYTERLARSPIEGPLDLETELVYLRGLWRQARTEDQRLGIVAVATWLKDVLAIDSEIEWLNPSGGWFS